MTAAPLDDDYLTTFALEQQAAAYRKQNDHADRCKRCRHVFHGLPCTAEFPSPCTCPSAWEAS
jgi:hypothetical protein